MTLIAVYNSQGCVGRCDARCYDAHSPDCDCICGGANHGKGLDTATANTRAYFEKWMEDYAEKNNLPKDARWKSIAHQMTFADANHA